VKKKVSVIINIAVLALAGFFLYYMIRLHPEISIAPTRYTVGMLIVFAAVVLVLHFLKMSRLFFIMLEQKIRPVRFIQIYARTAFTNFLVPYKLGEIYRFYCLADATKNPQIGLLSVVADRFFDTCALLFMLIPLELTYTGTLSMVTVLLIVFLILCVMIFAAFPPLYNYLNRFLILNTKSKNSARALSMLEDLRRWYLYLRSLLKGRVIIIILLSGIAWLLEYFALVILSRAMGTVFVMKDFITYIHSIFYLNVAPISSVYIIASAIILAVIAALFFAILHLKKEDKRNV
jgi:hypothetical protein